MIGSGQIRPRYQIGANHSFLLFMGDLEERQGPDILLRAMPGVLRLHPNTHLVIVGEGTLDALLGTYARYLQIEEAVTVVGPLPEKARAEILAACDVVVMPSRGATPRWPIEEAWAAGKAVVATHEAASKLTEHDKDAQCVYPSENSIRDGIVRLLGDPALRQRLGEAGRRKLAEQWSRPGQPE